MTAEEAKKKMQYANDRGYFVGTRETPDLNGQTETVDGW